MASSWRLATTYARRELRGGLAGFRVFLACLTLGVAAIAGVGSVSSALVEGLSQEGQTILGGDVALRLAHREASPEELAYISEGTRVTKSAEMRAMAQAPRTDERTLIELKSVDGFYPLYGEVTLEPKMGLARALEKRDGRFGVAVEPNLMDRLNARVGDILKVGELNVELRAVIDHEPDRVGGGLALGPRVFLSDAAMADTGLIRRGSLVQFFYRVQMPEASRTNAAVAAWVNELRETLPDAGWRIQDRSDSAPSVRRFVERVALFLSLVGLTALVVGGVGVGNAVNSYLEGKREVIATFKCLGAPGGLIFQMYLVQVMALALVGVVLGLMLGSLIPFIVQQVAGDMIPIPTRFALYMGPLVLAGAYGLLTALAFAIWPLARAREIPASSLFRDLITPTRRWPRVPYVLATGLSLAGLVGLAIGLTEERLFAIWFVVGAAASFVILRFTAVGFMALAKRAPRIKVPELRLAIANLHRPGAATSSVVLSLGLGLTLLVSISLIDGNISQQVSDELPDRAPSFFFVDIGPDQVDGFEELVRSIDGVDEFNRVPMLRGKITNVAGTASEDLSVPPNVKWALQGDRGITYSQDMPEGSTLVRGEWWPEDYDGKMLVSLSEELAAGFGVGPGDEITVNVLGRNLTAEIANTREIDWTTVGINFVLVFSPGVLESAPHTFLATVSMGVGDEAGLQRSVTRAYPNITSVRVKEALEAVNSMVQDFALAVRAISMVTLIAGVLVLGGAMAAGHRRRVYDAVVLKVLGATRRRILTAYLYEYALLGFGTAVIASAAGGFVAWLVITQVMDARWTFLPGTLIGTVVGASILTIVLGLAGTWQALSAKAAPVLRAE